MSDKERTLYCGNVHPKVTEELLWELFLQAGPLEQAKIVTDREGNRKSFAFIVYKHDVSVPYAIKVLEGSELYGRMLEIRFRHEDARIQSGDLNNSNNPQTTFVPRGVSVIRNASGAFQPFTDHNRPNVPFYLPLPMHHIPPPGSGLYPCFAGVPLPPQMARPSFLGAYPVPLPLAFQANPGQQPIDVFCTDRRESRKNSDVDYRFPTRSTYRARSRSRSPPPRSRNGSSDAFREHVRNHNPDHILRNDRGPSRDRHNRSPPDRRNYYDHDDRHRDANPRERQQRSYRR